MRKVMKGRAIVMSNDSWPICWIAYSIYYMVFGSARKPNLQILYIGPSIYIMSGGVDIIFRQVHGEGL